MLVLVDFQQATLRGKDRCALLKQELRPLTESKAQLLLDDLELRSYRLPSARHRAVGRWGSGFAGITKDNKVQLSADTLTLFGGASREGMPKQVKMKNLPAAKLFLLLCLGNAQGCVPKLSDAFLSYLRTGPATSQAHPCPAPPLRPFVSPHRPSRSLLV